MRIGVKFGFTGMILAGLVLSVCGVQPVMGGTPDGKAPVEFRIYVMSQCPYAVEALKGVEPVVAKFGASIDFKVEFIGVKDGEEFVSLHGPAEVQADLVQVCAQKVLADPAAFLKLVNCMGVDVSAMPGNWEKCAKDQGISANTARSISACAGGEEGKTLLSKSFDASADAGAMGSPTITVGGQPYAGRREELDLSRSLCKALEGVKTPDLCKALPPPVEVRVLLLFDSRCTNAGECDPATLDQMVAAMQALFPGLKLERLDYLDPKGKALFAEEKVQLLPAILFDESVKAGEAWTEVEPYLVPTASGKYLSLRMGARFDPLAEICDNKVDDTGDGKVDCEDPGCQGRLLCRPEVPGKLEVFIMAFCPYGVQAIMALKEVQKAFGDTLKIEVHYVADMDGDKLVSMHGPEEAEEDLRQMCIRALAPAKQLPYMWCRYETLEGGTWEGCATKVGVEPKDVAACVSGPQGVQLAMAEVKLGMDLGIEASPTWVAHNRLMFNGIDAETVRQNVCTDTFKPQGCDKPLSTGSTVPDGSCQ